MKESNEIKEDMWVGMISEDGERAVGRTFLCPTRNKIRIRFINEKTMNGGLIYLADVHAIAPIELVWEEVYVEQTNEEDK